MELTDNILWLLKQAFYFSLKTVNDAISSAWRHAPHRSACCASWPTNRACPEPNLARRLLISPQGVQLAITALERRGLVERKQDPQHGRILQAYLTDEGRRSSTAVLTDAMAAHDRVFGVLDRRTAAAVARPAGPRGRAGHRPPADHAITSKS